jgi:hypothetical protein
MSGTRKKAIVFVCNSLAFFLDFGKNGNFRVLCLKICDETISNIFLACLFMFVRREVVLPGNRQTKKQSRVGRAYLYLFFFEH